MNPAIETLLATIRILCPGLSGDELAAFVSMSRVQELKKKDIFLRAGAIQKSIGFIAKGLVRSSYVDNDGNEITVGFYAEGDYATHYPSFIRKIPSSYTIQCLEPVTMVCLSYDDIQQTYQRFPKVERYGRLVAEEILKRQQARIEGFIFQTAEQRYLDFMQQHPGLYNRVSLSQLCSYLGIERQTLTRIRQRLAHS